MSDTPQGTPDRAAKLAEIRKWRASRKAADMKRLLTFNEDTALEVVDELLALVDRQAQELEEDFDSTALEVLCRVFDDGADAGIEEWRAWYQPAQWLHPSRALGAFIRSRLMGPSQPAEQANARLGAVLREHWPAVDEALREVEGDPDYQGPFRKARAALAPLVEQEGT